MPFFFIKGKKMKKIYILICLIFACFFCLPYSFGITWKNSLKPKGETVSINLTQREQYCFDIVIPANPNEYEIKAGDVLAKYLKQIFNIDFKIFKENQKYGNKFISLGETKLLEYSNLKDNIFLNEDGYAIKEKNGNVYIFGGIWTGPLNGVYALLEEDLGCRFWTKLHDDSIPKIKTGKLVFSPRVFNPRFITRGPTNSEMFDGLYIEQNRFRSYDAYGFCHTAFTYVSQNDFENHPEQFAMRGGVRYPDQLCWSNPANIDIITNCVINLAKSGVKRINISPMDGIPLCECPLCSSLDSAQGTKAASYIQALNTVCERIEKDYPFVKIFGLAYLDYVTPPKSIKPHKNITVQICSDSSDWPWPFCTYYETGKFASDVNLWVKTGADTLTWNYVTNFDHYLLPNPNLKVVSDNIKMLDEMGVGGVFLQGNSYPNAICDSGYMKTWVWGKLLINPKLDYMDLMRDFIYGYYGECADEIYSYEKSLIALREKAHKIPHNPNKMREVKVIDGLASVDMKQYEGKGVDVGGIRWTPDASIYTDKFVDDSLKLMDKALKKVKSSEMRDKIMYMRCGPIYLKLGREVGYYQGSNNWISKDFDKGKTEYYLSLVNELSETLNKFNVDTVAETMPWEGNSKVYINKWKRVLTQDYTGFEKLSFNDNWYFRGDLNSLGKDSPIPKEAVDSLWKSIEVGKEWDLQGYDEILGNGWYKKEFQASRELLKNENIYFATGGVDEEITIFVNGILVKEHTILTENKTIFELYKTPISFDLKPYLREGENDLTIMVGNHKGYGGLYKPIYLVLCSKTKTSEDIVNLLF